MPRNILFIMCDQLRWDYLSCYGHLKLHTPNIDSLAARGVRFDNAYCQAPICGPSRASFYTGRYQSSHGVMANEDPMRVDELTIADYLRPSGYRSALVGKAHNRKSAAAMESLGVTSESDSMWHSGSGGYEPFELHEGLYPDGSLPDNHGYTTFLNRAGYAGKNPWQEYANSGEDKDGNIRSGWRLRNSVYPSRVDEAHSETTFLTNRAIDFLEQQEDDNPWCLHLSYIKPHWPLIAPAPYHDLYSGEDVQAVVRSDKELHNPHPVYRAFMEQEYSESFAREDVRERVIPVYMGLVRQIDDQLGRLFEYMKQTGIFEKTMLVFTSDHGEYLGDHWLGEKDLFHEASVKIPLIIVNPNATADETRGSVCNEMVEAIDLLPTFIEFAGGNICHERVEGCSLMPLLRSHSAPADWRQYALSEIDYSDRGPRTLLDIAPYDCRATMVRDQRWKYIHHNLYRPQLFDMQRDPNELNDLGEDLDHSKIRRDMRQLLIDSRRRLKPRVGASYDDLAAMGPGRDESRGIIIGRW
ncbi:MAG: sulfatase-like hydrolase/transferase [Gammaproteobacteria bacterium]|nr:sulfatase-like hydrolase/transferase [Gammaproteobacteria bacterium]MDH3858156.1 sulfatase-like hydrolase/transferase [Gammaproteobacteria bacterium]